MKIQRPCSVCGENKIVCCSGKVDLGAAPGSDPILDPVCSECCPKHSGIKRPAHEKIQPNGVCWDCDSAGAIPVVKADSTGRVTLGLHHITITNIGWRCKCGRWWEVRVSDISNWAIAFLKMMLEEADGGEVGQVKLCVPDLDAIERILNAHHECMGSHE